MMQAAAARFSARDAAAALAVVLIWGSNFVAMKYALHDFTPFQLGAARYVFAVLPLVLVIRAPRLHWKWVLLYGLTQGVGQFGFLFSALQAGMTAALASVLMQTQAFFTAVFGFVLLRERANRPLQIGLLLAGIGLCCFGMNYVTPGAAADTTLWGLVLNLCAAVMWAASNIVARKAQQASGDFDALAFVVWGSLVPILPFVGLTLLLDPPATRWQWLDAPIVGWVAVAYLGWVATVLAYGLWTTLLKRHPANKVAPFTLGVPVVGLSAGVLVLGETVTAWQWAGVAFIVAALGCVMLGGLFKRG